MPLSALLDTSESETVYSPVNSRVQLRCMLLNHDASSALDYLIVQDYLAFMLGKFQLSYNPYVMLTS